MAATVLYGSGSITSKTTNVFHKHVSRNKDVLMPQDLFTTDSLLEICNSFWSRSPVAADDVQPYVRGCKWSPDGTCCLSVVNRDGFHVMELPLDLYEGCPTRDRMITLLPAAVHVKESGLVYDFCWYPNMNSQYPESCSWISTKSKSPIQMWDAYDGSLRGSYRAYNSVDEMEPAISVTFIDNGRKIVGGYKKFLRTFDVARPGREFTEHKINSPASCIATSGKLLAIGSWNSNIQLFSIYDTSTYKSYGNMHAHKGGITYLMFTPDGSKLVSGARKDHTICVWDVRYFRRPLNILKRCVTTNQRIYFDISSCGRYLASGGTDGVIRIWDDKVTRWTEQFNVNRGTQENATFRFQLYQDCCNSISIHPSRPIIATGSGQYHVLDPIEKLDFESDISIICGTTEQIELGNTNVPLTEDIVTVSTTTDPVPRQDVNESTTNDGFVIAATQEIPLKSPDHSVREQASNAIDFSDDSPPVKKPKWDSCVNVPTTCKEIVDPKTSVSIVNQETCKDNTNQANIINILSDTDLTIIEVNERSETEIENKNLYNNTQINVEDIPLPPVMLENLSSGEPSDQISITKEPPDCKNHLDSNSGQYIESDIKNNAEANTVSSPVITELNSKSDTATDKKFNTSENICLSLLKSNSLPSVQLNQSPANVKLSIIRSCTELSHISNRKSIDSKYSFNNTLEPGEGHYNIDENKVKYSSYAENNLTFWWTGKVLKGSSQD